MTRTRSPARGGGRWRRGGGLVEGGEDAAAGVGALGDLEAEVAGDDRGEAAGHAVGVRAGAAAELEDVAEALGGDQAGAGEAALEDGVGGGGGAVDDQVDLGEVDPRPRRGRRGRRVAWFVGGGRGLGEADGAGGGVEQHEVGEGAAHVDAGDDAAGHACARSLTSRRVGVGDDIPVCTRRHRALGRAAAAAPPAHPRTAAARTGGGRQEGSGPTSEQDPRACSPEPPSRPMPEAGAGRRQGQAAASGGAFGTLDPARPRPRSGIARRRLRRTGPGGGRARWRAGGRGGDGIGQTPT